MKTVGGPFSSDMSPGSFWSDVCTHHQTKIPADRERGDVEDTDVLKHGSAMLPLMRQINLTHALVYGTLVTRHNQRTCPIRCTNHRTCPTDMFTADKILSLLGNLSARPYTRSDMSAETGPRTSFSGHVRSCVRGLRRFKGTLKEKNVFAEMTVYWV